MWYLPSLHHHPLHRNLLWHISYSTQPVCQHTNILKSIINIKNNWMWYISSLHPNIISLFILNHIKILISFWFFLVRILIRLNLHAYVLMYKNTLNTINTYSINNPIRTHVSLQNGPKNSPSSNIYVHKYPPHGALAMTSSSVYM